MYEFLEAEGIDYAIRLPANQIVQERISDLLRRPVGRPAHYVQRFYRSFRYQAGSWSRPRRIVAKVEWHHGELFPRVGFIVTNLPYASKNVVAFYDQRGTAEQHIKEGKNAIRWTRLSCARLPPMQCGFNCTPWRTILGTSFARSQRLSRSKIGRSPACARSSSRSAQKSSVTAGTSPSKWLKLPSRAVCSRTSCG